ncbi:MAG: hypothetical protein ACREPM_15205 [Gemmatimonadaceae bacterium]
MTLIPSVREQRSKGGDYGERHQCDRHPDTVTSNAALESNHVAVVAMVPNASLSAIGGRRCWLAIQDVLEVPRLGAVREARNLAGRYVSSIAAVERVVHVLSVRSHISCSGRWLECGEPYH